ncbi:MAG TPA: DNA-binding response regulator [Firmicutes bacterium]|jgi:DNA-binding LytR/AlgR family response regulator|nr:DNA-binding response regulator [Bacillota bacterium]
MSITVGICDDCPEQIELLKGYLYRFDNGAGLTVVSSADPLEFLARLKENKPDLVFLDIDMRELNGIELGEKIRAEYEAVIIVYITAYEQYALEAFRVRAFHYLLKPLTEEKFARVFQEAVGVIQKIVFGKTAKKSFVVRRKDETICLDYDDIDYFEKAGHKIKVHTGNSALDYYGNFIKLLEEIDPGFFVQCHQGYIVNINKVRGYRDKTIFLEGNLPVPVSRSYTINVKERLAKKLFTGAGEL